jgi:hypothetical protein
MLDTTLLKNALKWMFCDKVVILFAVVGIILLLVTLIGFAENVDSIKYRGMEYSTEGTVYYRLLFKMTSPALSVYTLPKIMNVKTIPQYLILYPLMFAIQIIIYSIIGKVASIISSGRIVAVCVCIGIVLLVFAIAYEINPAQESIIDSVRGKPFYFFLTISNLPTLLAGQRILVVCCKTALLYFILFPLMFVVQIIIYGFLGKLLTSMLSYLQTSA